MKEVKETHNYLEPGIQENAEDQFPKKSIKSTIDQEIFRSLLMVLQNFP